MADILIQNRDFIALAALGEHLARLLPAYDFFHHVVVGFGQLVHAFFQRVDIFLRQGMIEIDVIIEAVVDNRTDRHFRIGPQLLNRVSQQMRAGVANNFQTRFIFSGNDGDGGIFGDGIDRIH